MNIEVVRAAEALAKEKGISQDVLFGAIEEALKSAYRKNFRKASSAPAAQNVDVSIDRTTGATADNEEIRDLRHRAPPLGGNNDERTAWRIAPQLP